jgi:YtkA-like protein
VQFVKRYPIPIALAVVGVIALGTGAFLLTRKSSPAGAKISADVRGKGYYRTVVVQVNDRSGAPIQGADVTAQGTMTFPHDMTLIEKPLREVSNGKYRGTYTFIMKGDWTVSVDVMDKQGKESKRDFPIVIG